jgi:fructokinase
LLREKFNTDTCAKGIMNKFNIELIAVTKGAEGSTLFKNKEKDDCRMISSAVVDTLGAGDAFAAILCLGYIRNWNLAKINILANEFANQICQIKGALPQEDDIYEMMKDKSNEE